MPNCEFGEVTAMQAGRTQATGEQRHLQGHRFCKLSLEHMMRSRAVYRHTLSISSWFCVPEQGMNQFEILSRGSAFLVQSDASRMVSVDKSRSFPLGVHTKRSNTSALLPTYHVVTSSHVVSPWKWPNYYPEEWLQHVNEQHTYYTLEVRDEHGVFITQAECRPVTYHHLNKDLAVLHMDDEGDSLAMMKEAGYKPLSMIPHSSFFGECAVNMRDGRKKPSHYYYKGLALNFHGHDVTEDAQPEGGGDFDKPLENRSGSEGEYSAFSGGDERIPIPKVVDGRVEHNQGPQIFCKTASILTYGMCGGPVIVDSKYVMHDDVVREGGSSSDALVCGLIEGIVPSDHSVEELQGSAVFIESDDIHEFIAEVERGPEKDKEGSEVKYDMLVGGHVVEHVANNMKDEDDFFMNLVEQQEKSEK
jgi:hypothetical protein